MRKTKLIFFYFYISYMWCQNFGDLVFCWIATFYQKAAGRECWSNRFV